MLASMMSVGGELKVRKAAVAGQFYPAEASELSQIISRLLAKASTPVDGRILAAVAPHAGIEYSGPVAAYTFASLKGRRYSRVVLIAPSHYSAFEYTSIYDGDQYETPLGKIQVDTGFARGLVAMHPSIKLSEKGHTPAASGGEHAIEVQLPWLQKVLGDFEVVPIVMGSQSYDSSRALAKSLAKLVQDENDPEATLLLASSDLSHYHTYREAQMLDAKTLEAMRNWDYLSMARNFNGRVWEACGGAPVITAMIYAEQMGANRAEVLQYQNSGDTSGDQARVVGYASVAFVNTEHCSTALDQDLLSGNQKAELISLARKSVEEIVSKHRLFEPSTPADEALNRESGAFVTLLKNGRLRGCVGYTSAVKPLYIAVRDTAALAATRDTRFLPVTIDELPELSLEVSVLSPLRHVRNVDEIEIGRDGLLIKNQESEGLLLPQVPLEHGWDRMRFLEETCVKAGMSRDSWCSEDTDIFLFSAQVFRETASSKAVLSTSLQEI